LIKKENKETKKNITKKKHACRSKIKNPPLIDDEEKQKEKLIEIKPILSHF